MNNESQEKNHDEFITLAQFINDHKTVVAAARALGISRQTIDRWRKGKFKPSQAQVELAKQKGVDLTRFLVPGIRGEPII